MCIRDRAIGAVVAIAAIVAVATLVLNEREIGERWGIAFMGKRPPEENERTRLARRCATVAEARRLTPREREVLSLIHICGVLLQLPGPAARYRRVRPRDRRGVRGGRQECAVQR